MKPQKQQTIKKPFKLERREKRKAKQVLRLVSFN